MAIAITTIWPMKEISTVQVLCVFPWPSTNVCSNITFLLTSLFHRFGRTLARRACGGPRRLGGSYRRRSRPLPVVGPIVPEQHDGAGHEHGRIRTDNNTYH